MESALVPTLGSNPNERIGRAVAAAMKVRGAKGTDVARLLGISTSSLSARLNGHTPFRADQLIALGEYLRINPGQFLSETPEFPLRAEWELIAGGGGIGEQLHLLEPDRWLEAVALDERVLTLSK